MERELEGCEQSVCIVRAMYIYSCFQFNITSRNLNTYNATRLQSIEPLDSFNSYQDVFSNEKLVFIKKLP